jgi:multidrug resistance efflux pump
VRNGYRAEEIDAARARLRQAEAAYRKVLRGARPQEIEQARAAERAARARLAQAARGATAEERNQARARVARVEAELELAKKDLQRYRILFDEGAVSRQRLDQAQALVESLEARRSEAQQAYARLQRGTPPEELQEARAAHREAEAALKLALAGSRPEDKQAAAAEASAARANLRLLESGSRPEDIRAAQSRLDQAIASLDLLKSGAREEQIEQARAAADAARAQARAQAERTGEREIRAAEDGTVERILVAIGDLVNPGTPVIRISNPSDTWIRVYVPESDLARIRAGDPAELRVDGIADSVSGVVESIASRGEFTPVNLQTPKERGRQVFAVRLRMRNPDPRVKPGMYATIRRIGEWEP